MSAQAQSGHSTRVRTGPFTTLVKKGGLRAFAAGSTTALRFKHNPIVTGILCPAPTTPHLGSYPHLIRARRFCS
jgi:hypothetical protein